MGETRFAAGFPEPLQELAVTLAMGGVLQDAEDYSGPASNIPNLVLTLCGLAIVSACLWVPWHYHRGDWWINLGYAPLWNPPFPVGLERVSVAQIDTARVILELIAIVVAGGVVFILLPGPRSPSGPQVSRAEKLEAEPAVQNQTKLKLMGPRESVTGLIEALRDSPSIGRALLIMFVSALLLVVLIEVLPQFPAEWLEGLKNGALFLLIFGALIGFAWWKAATDPKRRYLLTGTVSWRDLNWPGKTLVIMAVSVVAFMAFFAIADQEWRRVYVPALVAIAVLVVATRLLFRRLRRVASKRGSPTAP